MTPAECFGRMTKCVELLWLGRGIVRRGLLLWGYPVLSTILAAGDVAGGVHKRHDDYCCSVSMA